MKIAILSCAINALAGILLLSKGITAGVMNIAVASMLLGCIITIHSLTKEGMLK